MGAAVVSAVAALVVATVWPVAARSDDGVLNRTEITDPVGDSTGIDLASMAVTTYTDGTLGIVIGAPNRPTLLATETLDAFIDLDGNGTADVAITVWGNGRPIYLYRKDAGAWVIVRQAPEASYSSGAFAVRIAFSILRDASGVVPSDHIGVSAGAWPVDVRTGAVGTTRLDSLPDGGRWLDHAVTRPQAPPQSPPPPPAPPTPPPPPPPTTTTTAAPKLPQISPTEPRLQTIAAAHGVLVVSLKLRSLPSGAVVDVRCRSGCNLNERYTLTNNTFASRIFPGNVVARTASLSIRVERDGWIGYFAQLRLQPNGKVSVTTACITPVGLRPFGTC